MVTLALLVLYSPHGWVLFSNGRWEEQWHRIKMWPELPGAVASFLLLPFIQRFSPHVHAPEWLPHVLFGGLTLLILWAVIKGAIRFRDRPTATLLTILAASILMGFLSYGMFAA